MKVLIVEDDRAASDHLAKALREHNHAVDQADNGVCGLGLASEERYDALIVDRMLPTLDGLTMIEALRRQGKDTPILIVSALGDVDERVRGLRCGGDDYLAKPFAFQELLARLEAIVRRRTGTQLDTTLSVSDLVLERLSRHVTRAGREIQLQAKEFMILEYLMQHAGQVVTRTMLLESIWDYHFDPQTNVIDVHISRLRRKVDHDFDPPLIHTVRGAGYVIREVP